MNVAELWRYPVKSMAGEKLEMAEISALGLPGDRELRDLSSLHVRSGSNPIIS